MSHVIRPNTSRVIGVSWKKSPGARIVSPAVWSSMRWEKYVIHSMFMISKRDAIMSPYHIVVSSVLDVPATKVYDILADYQTGHPAILPRPAFTSIAVEQGGRGAGTVVVARMQAMGGERSFRLVVTEP